MPSPSLLLTLVCSSPQNCRAPRHKNLCAPLHRSLIPPCATHSCDPVPLQANLSPTGRHGHSIALIGTARADQIGSQAPLRPWRSGQACCHASASLRLRRRRRAHPCGTRNHAQQGGARLRRGSARPAWGGATPPPPRIVSSCSASAIFQHERHPVRPRLHIPLHLLRVHPAAARERRYSWSAAWSYPATRRSTAGIVTGAARGGPPLRES